MADGINPPHFEEPKLRTESWFSTIYRWIQRRTKVASVTTTYSVAADVFWVRCDATGGAFSVTLPAAIDWGGRQIGIIKIDASANAVTVARIGSDTFTDAATSKSLAVRGAGILVLSNGNVTWDYLLSPGTASAAYTPSNVTTDRSFDADATTLDEVSDVLGTVIADLQARKLLG